MLSGNMLSWVLLCAANVAAAQLRLGVMYEHGLGVKLDYKVQTALDLQRTGHATYQCRQCFLSFHASW